MSRSHRSASRLRIFFRDRRLCRRVVRRPELSSLRAVATEMAEGSDDEDADDCEDNPFVVRSETIDGGGNDPLWFYGGETRFWDLHQMPRWMLVRAMDEDLDDDDHIGTAVIDIQKHFSDKYKALVIENKTEKFAEEYNCTVEQLLEGETPWSTTEWIDVKRDTPDARIDSGVDNGPKADKEKEEKARERHMADQRVMCHLMNGGDITETKSPAKPNEAGSLL